MTLRYRQVGNITSRYGVVETSVRNHAHGGLDIAAPYGTSIKAAADGTISYSGWMSGYGYLIIIDHANGVQTYYGHCSKLYASVGDEVTAGDVIAAEAFTTADRVITSNGPGKTVKDSGILINNLALKSYVDEKEIA